MIISKRTQVRIRRSIKWDAKRDRKRYSREKQSLGGRGEVLND